MKQLKTILIVLATFFISQNSFAQDSLWVREYQFAIYNNYDLRNSSTNAISTNWVLKDLYRNNVKPKMN